jgi:hypothetical protein
MELTKFLKKCDKFKNSEERVYMLIFDRYHYHECYKPYGDIKHIIKEITNQKRAFFINSVESCIQETEYYLTHLDNIYKLKKMGYTHIEI